MKRHTVLRLAVILVAAAATQAQAQNLLVNAGFEDPITTDGPPFIGFWEGFNAGAGSGAGNDATMPRTGAQHANLNITGVDNSFAGVFQDVGGLVAGQTGTFSVWHKTPSNPLDIGVEVRIEWRDSVNNVEIARTPNATPVPGSEYSLFSLAADVPAGADTARLTYAIQSFGPEPTNTGIVYLDDASFTIVPEPASIALVGLAGLAGVTKRRRS